MCFFTCVTEEIFFPQWDFWTCEYWILEYLLESVCQRGLHIYQSSCLYNIIIIIITSTPSAWILLTLFHQPSLSAMSFEKPSRRYPESMNIDLCWSANTVMSICRSYLPTPPHGQDMTQGQFLSRVWQVWIQSFPSPRLVASPRLKNPVRPTIYP